MAKKTKPSGGKYKLSFETDELRSALREFLQSPYEDPDTHEITHIGGFKWGVYIFYDYDREPIYVGQTKEQVSQRISRHLTNQRTDAVAMSVLDPFEVYEIEIFPLPQYEGVNSKHPDYKDAKRHLDALEYMVHQKAIAESRYKAILNEKDPLKPEQPINIPPSKRGCIVTEKVKELRGHEDVRLARRAQIIARLSQTIEERQVNMGLRRTLITQARRLETLASQRFNQLGGKGAVEKGPEESEEEDGDAE